MTMETITFLLNHTVTYYINVNFGNIVLKCKIASVSSIYSIQNPYYLHSTCIGKINRNYPVTREVSGQGAGSDIGSGPFNTHENLNYT